ncbi:MAG TPA: hypothetical protein P5522_09790 [Spirochaetia bacterium]|nr:hypothetical protein [Spirochaetia bacterium]
MPNQPTPTPMTAEEYWEEEAIQNVDPFTSPFKFAEAYADYRLRFERDNKQQPTDPYYTDPATWPKWANWTAVDVDNEMFAFEERPAIKHIDNYWVTASDTRWLKIRNVTHNPDWRNSLRSRKEVSRGK